MHNRRPIRILVDDSYGRLFPQHSTASTVFLNIRIDLLNKLKLGFMQLRAYIQM